MVRAARLGLLLLLLLGCCRPVHAQPTLPSWMIGLWYGEGYQPLFKSRFQWLMDRRADGTFEVEFRHYEECRLTYRSVETGTWSADSAQYVSRTLTINSRPVNVEHVYRIARHSDDEMDYIWVEGNVPFHSTKVDPVFRIPGCPTS